MTNDNINNSSSSENEKSRVRINKEKGLLPPKNVPETSKVKAPSTENKN